MDDIAFSEEEQAQLEAAGYYPKQDPKHNIHTFLSKVLETKDSTKVGFLNEDELGMPRHSVRNMKECALISSKILNNDLFTSFFNQDAEDVLATSLSRNAKLLTIAVTQKRTVADETKIRKPSSSWFKSKPKPDDENL